MKKEEIIGLLQEKEKLKEQTEYVYHQILGQIALLRDLLKREDAENAKESVPKE